MKLPILSSQDVQRFASGERLQSTGSRQDLDAKDIEIVRQYQEGVALSEIAVSLSMTSWAVAKKVKTLIQDGYLQPRGSIKRRPKQRRLYRETPKEPYEPDAIDEAIIRVYNAGLTTQRMQIYVGLTHSQLWRRLANLRSHNLISRTRNKRKPNPLMRSVEQVADMIAQSIPYKNIAAEFGMSEREFYVRLVELRGHPRMPAPRVEFVWTPEKVEQLAKLREQNLSYTQISKVMGATRSAVQAKVFTLTKRGLLPRRTKA